MEFNEKFYENLFKLISSPDKNASAELLEIVNDVKEYYLANGITELWQSSSSETGSEYPTAVATKRSSDSALSISIARKDNSAAESEIQQPSSIQISNAKSQQQSDVAAFVPTTTLNDSFSRSVNKNNSLISADDSIDIFGEPSADDAGESLRIVPNFEENEDGIDTIEEFSSKSNKDEETGTVVSVSISPKISASFSDKGPLLERFACDESMPKIRKLGDRSSPAQPLLQQKTAEESEKTETFDDLNLSCVVCNQMKFSTGNYLLECHECHLMYHQKCHEPNVPQSQFNDPRLLWYCSACSKKLKKSTQKPNSTTKSANKETVKDKQKQATSSLKQNEMKDKSSSINLQASTSSTNLQNQKPLTGVASLAADFLAKHKNKTTSSAKPGPVSTGFGVTSASSTSSFASGLVGLGKLAAAQRVGAPASAPSSSFAAPSSSSLAPKSQPVGPGAVSVHSISSSSTPGTAPAAKPVPKQPSFISPMQAAEKRLQVMKKKAASKSFIK